MAGFSWLPSSHLEKRTSRPIRICEIASAGYWFRLIQPCMHLSRTTNVGPSPHRVMASQMLAIPFLFGAECRASQRENPYLPTKRTNWLTVVTLERIGTVRQSSQAR